MPRFYLKCPKCAPITSYLRPRSESSEGAFYQCPRCYRHWVLWITGGLAPVLSPLDAESQRIDRNARWPIGEGWEGEPRIIGIQAELWNDLHSADLSENQVLLLQEIRRMAENGDVFIVYDDNGGTTQLSSADLRW